jgi:glycosyltransferase involved in cell wall biosynthesis
MPIKQVSVVIPARNEQDTIGPVLDTLNTAIAQLPQYRFETIVVVDDPADPTAEIARSKSACIVINTAGRGKGAALYTGFRNAAGDAFIIFDSDGSHNPADIGLFLEALEKGAGLVIGSRVLGGSSDHNVIRLFGNALFTVLFSILFNTTIMDTLNGYKAFVKDVVSGYKPKAHGFDVEIEIAAQAFRKGYQVAEVRTHENRRAGGRMKSHALRDGFAILRACLREGVKYRAWRLFHSRKQVRSTKSEIRNNVK